MNVDHPRTQSRPHGSQLSSREVHSELVAARIIVAEDDRDMREMLASSLRRRGHEVVECENGAILLHAIDLLTRNRRQVDLIISDVRMPGLPGMRALEMVRAEDPYVPVIVMTGFPEIDARVEASELGVAGFFAKPFDIEEICQLADQLLHSALVA